MTISGCVSSINRVYSETRKDDSFDMLGTDASIDLSDVPVGRGGRISAFRAGQVVIGSDDRLSFRLGVAREARILPDEVDCWSTVAGMEDGPTTVRPVALIEEVARAWRALAFEACHRSLPRFDFGGTPFRVSLERAGMIVTAASTLIEGGQEFVAALLDTDDVLSRLDSLGSYVASRLSRGRDVEGENAQRCVWPKGA